MLDKPVQLEQNGLKIEANWNEKVKPGKNFRFTIDGKSAIIDKDTLYSLLMVFGDEREQEKLIPVSTSKVRMLRKRVKIKALKDVKMGEIITFMHEYPVASEIYDKIVFDENLQSTNKDGMGTIVKHLKDKDKLPIIGK